MSEETKTENVSIALSEVNLKQMTQSHGITTKRKKEVTQKLHRTGKKLTESGGLETMDDDLQIQMKCLRENEINFFPSQKNLGGVF